MNIFVKNGCWSQLVRDFWVMAGRANIYASPLSTAVQNRLIVEFNGLSLWIPVLMGTGIAFYFSLPVEPFWGWTTVFLVGTAGNAILLRHRGTIGLLAIALFCFVLGAAAAQLRTMLVAAPVLHNELMGRDMDALVLRASGNNKGGTNLLVTPSRIEGLERKALPATIRLKVAQEHEPLWPGDSIAVRAILWPPAEPVAPGAFDFARQSWFRQLGGTGITLAAPVRITHGQQSGWQLALNRLRERITRRVIKTMSDDTGPVAAAMMTGQRHAISDEVEQNLRDAGLAHILAISGLHMALFAGTLFWLARATLALIPRFAVRYPVKKWAAMLALLGAFSYLLISGMSVSTQRAFIMAALMFLAILWDRPALSLRNVALAAFVILLTRPESLLEPGFQMSFAAVTALIAVYQTRELQFLDIRQQATGITAIMRLGFIYVVTLALTSLVAGAATAPFAAFHFNRIAVYGLVGNLAAMPLVGVVIMPAALIAFLLMPFGLDAPALWVMDMGLTGVLQIAEQVAKWNGAIVYAPAISMSALAALVFGGLLLALLRTELRYVGLIFLAAGGMLSSFHRSADILIDGEAKLVAVRVQEGAFERVYVWTGTTRKYARETWLRRSGQSPDTDIRDHMMVCDRVGCVATGPVTVAISKTAAALADDCARADILIAFMPVRGATRRNCKASLIIDRFDIAREGAQAIYLNEDGSTGVEAIETVRQWRGVRPWTGE